MTHLRGLQCGAPELLLGHSQGDQAVHVEGGAHSAHGLPLRGRPKRLEQAVIAATCSAQQQCLILGAHSTWLHKAFLRGSSLRQAQLSFQLFWCASNIEGRPTNSNER